MRPIDIRTYKNSLRENHKQSRREIDEDLKKQMDGQIRTHVTRLYQYRSCKIIYVYVSTSIEVDTIGIIEDALQTGKRVAVPRCIAGTREMVFHYITSLDDLHKGAFSVLEPSEHLPVAGDYVSSIMLVPALSLDSKGFRLGYGKGYYDRYMANFTGQSVGICYSMNCVKHMYHGRFDRPVDLIITEKGIKKSIK